MMATGMKKEARRCLLPCAGDKGTIFTKIMIHFRLAEGEDELWRRGGDVLNHHIETLYRKEEAKAFRCSLCEKTLQSKRKIYAHIESHLDLKFSCTICEAKSPTRNALVEHARVRHNLNIGYR